ncbi:MAG: alkaline phosphatase family protein [Anaerolineae bacterium]|nr:alkaline phosphatase family protein [Anaerolineae bacterium]
MSASALFLPSLADQPGLVEFFWSGAVTPTSATVKAKLRLDSEAVRLAVSHRPDLSRPFFSAYSHASQTETNRVVSLQISGLQPNRQYYYAIEVDGVIDLTRRGKFRTFPAGPASFSFAFGSCAETGSAHPIFETIRRRNPLFFLHTGDMHYLDIAANDRNLFRQAYETVLASPTQAALYREVPLVYMWDDHDFGPNDSDALAAGREASRLTYQEVVPHYPLPAGQGNVPIYQAFTVGRVRFLITDTRSERSPKSAPDDANKTMLGQAQKAWLKQELLQAKELFRLVVWVSPAAWIPDLSDGWTLYSTERRELADFIKENEIKNVVMLTGDLHLLGIDNGRHSAFANSGGDGFPVMQASPLDRFPFEEGIPFAPYSEGVVAQRGVFGLMLVFDTGGATLTVHWSGRNSLNEEMLGYTFTI